MSACAHVLSWQRAGKRHIEREGAREREAKRERERKNETIQIYIYIERERERAREYMETQRETDRGAKDQTQAKEL